MQIPVSGLSGVQADQQASQMPGQTGLRGMPAEADKPAGDAPSGNPIQDQIQSAIELLQGPLGQQFDDPSFRRAAARYDEFLNGGKQPAGVTKEDLYDFGTRLFTRELRDGVGSQLPDGSIITSKKLVSARQRGDDLILELDVSAQKPDGTHYNYRAPVTKNRTHEDTDEVLQIPIGKIQDRIRGALYMSKAVEQAGGVKNVIDYLQQQAQQVGQQQQAPDAPQGGLQGMQSDHPEGV